MSLIEKEQSILNTDSQPINSEHGNVKDRTKAFESSNIKNLSSISQSNRKISEEFDPLDVTPKIVSSKRMIKMGQYRCANKYLDDGWRVNYFKFSDCTRSLFQLHNETLNIWTHLIGSIILIIIMIWFMLYLDYSKDFYVKMINNVKQLSFDQSFSTITLNIEDFKKTLVEIYQNQSTSVGNTIKSLDITITSILSNKLEI